jgi:hypothetical protein
MWHRSGPTRLSKAEPHLCQLMDRKEMAEGAMAPKCECNNLAPRVCKGEMAVSGPAPAAGTAGRRMADMRTLVLFG